MISCDTNILFIAFESSRPGHQAARRFLESHRQNPEFAVCDLVLMELYGLLRNPAVARRPLEPAAAAALIDRLRTNPRWDLLDYPGPAAGIMTRLWREAAQPGFARRRLYDVRLALTLRHHGVTEFATGNVRDFEGFGFHRVWNPIA
ncbi:MAG TPA: PIN domain-containing protein [Verrucomicrobiota bacterium]|nr:PIN domain-containing protein [Verrucomicrobiota bacterium]HNU50701.1 PIN domain-containing protein [Verrucomicrobiota bacterium]